MSNIGKLCFVAVVAIALTGCAYNTETDPGKGLTSVVVGYVTLPDGREVLCVSDKRGYSGGLSCDWESIAPKGVVNG